MDPRRRRKPNMPGEPVRDDQNTPVGPPGENDDFPVDEPLDERQRREDDQEDRDGQVP